MARALIPNSTQIPDVILDHWMAALSGAEFKVLLYVARRTYGFGKECDNISLNQMAAGIRKRDGTQLDHGTGLSRSGVKSACNSLIDRGILIRVNNRSEESRECEESTYRLNLYADPTGVGQKKAYVGHKKAQVGQKNTEGGPETDRGVGQNLAPQETVQETDQETAAGEGSRDALTLSIQAFHRFAPDGLQTPDQHFFTVHDAATGAKVGWLWYQVRDDGLYRSAYLCDILIFDEYRRQGYGTACLAELDNQAKGLGIRRVGLHVFGHNTEAMELYQRCGYKITDCTMAKDLP